MQQNKPKGMTKSQRRCCFCSNAAASTLKQFALINNQECVRPDWNANSAVSDTIPSPQEGFWGLSPPKQSSKPPKLNYEALSSVEFLSNFRMSSPLNNRKVPYWKRSGDGSDPIPETAVPWLKAIYNFVSVLFVWMKTFVSVKAESV